MIFHRIVAILAIFVQFSFTQKCKIDGKFCDVVLARFSKATLAYKCKLPVYLAKPDILLLDKTTYLTMPIYQYCHKSCCEVSQTTTVLPKTSTVFSTTTTVPLTTTVNQKNLMEKIEFDMENDDEFQNLVENIGINLNMSDSIDRFMKYVTIKQEVMNHNKLFDLGLSTFKMTTNSFSVATKDEIAPLSLNLSALKPAEFKIGSTSTVTRKKRDTVKNETVDWRPIMKPILNQKRCGGCWAFSIIGMIEGFFARQNWTISNLSVQQLLSCDRSIDKSYGVANIGCDGGYLQVAGTYLKSKGSRSDNDIPLDFEETSICESSNYAPAVPTILNFDEGYISEPANTTIIQAMEENIEKLVRNGPVSVGMAINDEIYSYANGIYDGDCGKTINHAVVIVGFTPDYWIIRNSWGSSWGEDGHMRVKRSSGVDRCKLYQYWSQATGIGKNETFVPAKKTGTSYVVIERNSTSNNICKDDCEDFCDICDDYDDDDDDSDDYLNEINSNESTHSETSSLLNSSSSSTNFASTTTVGISSGISPTVAEVSSTVAEVSSTAVEVSSTVTDISSTTAGISSTIPRIFSTTTKSYYPYSWLSNFFNIFKR